MHLTEIEHRRPSLPDTIARASGRRVVYNSASLLTCIVATVGTWASGHAVPAGVFAGLAALDCVSLVYFVRAFRRGRRAPG